MIIRIHKEGRKIIFWTAVTSVALSLLADVFFPGIVSGVITFFTVFFLAVVMFFRNPKRELMLPDDSSIYAPADGKIVAIEEIEE
ncbi:MAG TPA: phosphatidylserine decarboxylase family protein, partial [Phaeodactylibacter sp.]|nr:phosphatidylserine decarboxylase family protein [Phaeodactylibacter sp.]